MLTVQCPQCDGTGQDSDDRPCEFCNGMGKMSHEESKRKFPTLIPTKMSEFKTIIKEAYLVTEDYHTAANDFHHGWIELRKLMVQKTGGYKGTGYNDPRMAQAKQLYEKLSDIIDDIMK